MNYTDEQIERAHSKYDGKFSEILEKIIAKYESDKWIDYWRNRGYEPPDWLYWFVLQYASKYGRSLSVSEWGHYANMFTSEIYFYRGYYIQRMDGQGSVIMIQTSKI